MKNNAIYKFTTTQSDLTYLNGKPCRIIRPLTNKECDIADVGKMFKIRFDDNTIIDAFEDELIFVTM